MHIPKTQAPENLGRALVPLDTEPNFTSCTHAVLTKREQGHISVPEIIRCVFNADCIVAYTYIYNSLLSNPVNDSFIAKARVRDVDGWPSRLVINWD
jgi:hypothetical protein